MTTKTKTKASNGEYLPIKTLRECGRLMFGDRWLTQMADALQVAVRTVQRWDAETSPVPASIEGELKALLRERKSEIHDFLVKGF